MAYPDTFNRADGSLGDGWSVKSGTATIVSNMAHLVGAAHVKATGVSESGDQDHSVVIPCSAANLSRTGIILRGNAELTEFLWCAFNKTNGTGGYIGGYFYGGSLVPGAFGEVDVSGKSSITFRATYSGGYLRAYVDGVQVGSWDFSGYAAYTGVGFMLTEGEGDIDAFDAAGGATASMVVTPDPLWVGGGTQLMTATGTDTSWTPGEPGSSIITADHGTVEMQEVTSATTIDFLFTPAEYIGTITFTEDEYGATAEVEAVAVMPEGYPGALDCKLTDNGAAIINRAGATPVESGKRVITTGDVVTTSPAVFGVLDGLELLIHYLYVFAGHELPNGAPWSLSDVMGALNGGFTPTPGVSALGYLYGIDTKTDDIKAVTDGLRGVENWTLDDVLENLGGLPILNHQDLNTAINAIRGVENWTLDDLLHNICGVPLTNNAELMTVLNAIRTTSSYTFGTVVDMLNDRPTNLALAAAVASIQGSLGGIALEIAGIGVAETADAASSAAAATAAGSALAWLLLNGPTILDILNDLKDLLQPSSAPLLVPPIWPGETGIEWGEPIAIESNLPVPGPMHGVVVHVTGCQGGTRYFDYDGVKAWSHLGALAFQTDHGDLEPFQPLGYEHGIYCPRVMRSAMACRLYRSRNVRGTVTPWKIKPA